MSSGLPVLRHGRRFIVRRVVPLPRHNAKLVFVAWLQACGEKLGKMIFTAIKLV